jgi:hypothetical protein
MERCIAAAGIVLVMLGSYFVAYEVVRKFTGQSHIVHVAFGGPGRPEKTPVYLAWEARRSKFMWIGLALITLGSVLQLVGLFQ